MIKPLLVSCNSQIKLSIASFIYCEKETIELGCFFFHLFSLISYVKKARGTHYFRNEVKRSIENNRDIELEILEEIQETIAEVGNHISNPYYGLQ